MPIPLTSCSYMKILFSNLWQLFFSLILFGLATGLSASLVSLRALEEGFTSNAISLILTGYYIGYMGGSLRGGALISRIGHRRTLAVTATVAALCNLIIPINPSFTTWSGLEFIIGFCFGVIYVAIESWLNLVATDENRGRVMALYMFCLMLGLSGGPYLLNFYDVSSYELFSLLSLLLGLAAVFILMSTAVVPHQERIARLSVLKLWQYSPQSFVALIMICTLLGGIHGIAALYAKNIGMDTQNISIFVSLIYFGGFCLQWPFGYLSDRYNRFVVYALIAFTCALASFIASANPSEWVLMAMAFVFGGCSFPLYSVCAATIYDRVDSEEILPASSCVIFIGCLGSLIGPFLATATIDYLGVHSYFLWLGGLCASSGVIMLTRAKNTAYKTVS